MNIEQLLLKKEELPIFQETAFFVPIHPKLLNDDLNLDPYIAHRVFPQAAEEWYSDLQIYANNLEDGETKEWINRYFLKFSLKVKNDELGRQIVDPPRTWEDFVLVSKNGFARSLSISRNAGGSLYHSFEGLPQYISPPYVQFSPEKIEAYSIEPVRDTDGTYAHIYDHHNVDYYPGALFLRNWAILYLNEAMKSIMGKKKIIILC